MRSAPPRRAAVGAALVAFAALVALPHPRALRDASRLPALLDPALGVPFASALARAPDSRLAPGDRIVGLRIPGDAGLYTPRDRSALARTLERLPDRARVVLVVRSARGERSVSADLETVGARDALARQWPACLAGCVLLSFALASVLGGRHPIVTPLFAVSWCLGAGVLGTLDLVLPSDPGLFGAIALRARLAVLAWTTLPAALLHLAARFPVVVPRFRRPALAALPYLLWGIPALLAQLRFGEAAVLQAVERTALLASFVSGGILLAACAKPVRTLAPIERVRARAATVGLTIAGGGPLAAFLAGGRPSPAASTALALACAALPVSLGWAVARYRLLDPPPWLRRILVSAITGLAALLLSAAVHAAAGAAFRLPPASGVSLALLTAIAYPCLRSSLDRLARGAPAATPDALRVRASRELAGASRPADVLAGLARLLRDGLGAAEVELVMLDGGVPRSALGRRGLALWTGAGAPPALLHRPRIEDPDASEPEAILHFEPGLGTGALAVLAPRLDGLPYTAEEQRALGDVGRLAALALGDATASARLERRVAARTAELRRALADRTALLDDAEFLRSVAHELRKPNEEIRHLARSLRSGADASAQGALARIEAITHEMGRRLDLLLSRRIRSWERRRVDLVRVIDEAARRVGLLRSNRRFEVAHASRRLPLLGDPVRLASLVENLLDNAVRATADGGRVTVRSALRPPAFGGSSDTWLALEVADDGCGIPPDLGDELFEPGIGRFRGGFGLGLAFCREVVAQHGGRIEVESSPGRTVFRVLLPQLARTELES